MGGGEELVLSVDGGTAVAFERGDLTGHQIWRAAHVLCDELRARAPSLRGRRVMELGSGTGIGGLFAHAMGAESVLLTDWMPPTFAISAGADGELERSEAGKSTQVLDLLRSNADRNAGVGDGAVSVMELAWGNSAHLAAASAAAGPFDLIIGSDIFYAPEDAALSRLFATMRDALGAKDGAFALCASQVRKTSSEARVRRLSEAAGLGAVLVAETALAPEGTVVQTYEFRPA